MQRAVRIRLIPTPEQETLFRKSAGVARWAYNQFVGANEQHYQEWLQGGKVGKREWTSDLVLRRQITELKHTTHSWLCEVGSNVTKQAVKDANGAYQRFCKGLGGKPKFKSRHKSKPAFYVNYESLVRKPGGFHGEKIGFVKTATALPKLAKGKRYANPRISFDGKHWYLSVGYEVKPDEVELTNESLGIDLGVKTLAVVSNRDASQTMTVKNINKSAKVRNLKKRLRREQRKVSRRLNGNTKSYAEWTKRDKNGEEVLCRRPIWKHPLRECKNIERQNEKVNAIHRKLTNIRQNHLHQATAAVVKTKPGRIVLEDLNVRGMMKNKHLAEAVQEQKFYEFRRQIAYKAEQYGIVVVYADRFYASSKLCSHCGNHKKDLRLKDRVYRCEACGAVIDRDMNAAVNLANYAA